MGSIVPPILGLAVLVALGVLTGRREWPAAASPSPYGVAWWAIAAGALLYGVVRRGEGARLAATVAVALTLIGGVLLLIGGGVSLAALALGGPSVCGGGGCAARQTARLVGDFPLLELDVPVFLCALWVRVRHEEDGTPDGRGGDGASSWREAEGA